MITLGLRELLSPTPLEAFLAEWWERKPLLVRGDPDKLSQFLDTETFYKLIGEPRAHADARIKLKAGGQDALGYHVELPITADQVPRLHRLGLTVQAEGLEHLHPPARALIEDTRRLLGIAAPMDVGAFLSPDGSGYDLHFDGTAMWTLQLEGEKIWWYGREPVVPFPPYNRVATADERAAIPEGELVTQQLRPGDMLYLPPGTWHRAKAVGRSLHASLTIRPANVLELMRDALSPLLDHAPWRRLPSGDERGVQAALSERLGELRAWVEALTPAVLLDAWRRRVEGDRTHPPIRPAEALARVAAFQVTPLPEAQEIALQRSGTTLATLPRHAERFLASLCAMQRFRAGDALAWDPDYRWEDVEVVLRALVELGLLVREPA